jgi:hypothetical protein
MSSPNETRFGYDSQTPETGTPIAGDHPVYLADPVLDATVRMVVELAAQVWVDRERLLVVEQLLTERGLVTREAIESYRPSAQLAAAWKARRDQFVADVFKPLRSLPVRK